MSSTKSRFYFHLSVLFILGYSWIILALIKGAESQFNTCVIKSISGFPCPSCGSTRSVIRILEGDFWTALNTNPLGPIIFIALLIGPFWIIYDLALKKETLRQFYNKVELILRKKKMAIFAIIIVLANWLWNISKGL